MSDLIPATATPITADPDTGQPTPTDPFVRVYADKPNQRAIIALDGDAVDLLLQLLDDIGPGYDLTMNPGHYGLDQDTADRVAAVRAAISTPLNKLLGYL